MRGMNKIGFLAFVLLAGTACEGPWDLGGNIPIPGTKDKWCFGFGVGDDADNEGKVDWIDIGIHECVPYGFYGCSAADLEYTGAFGGATCQGYVYDNMDGVPVENDAYSMYFSVTTLDPEDIVTAEITYETDMMDDPATETLFAGRDGSDWLFGFHLLNPGYTSDGDRVEFTLNVMLNGVRIDDPTVWATLNAETEDVNFSATSGEYSSSW